MKPSFKYFVLLVCLNFIEGSFRCDYQYSSNARAWLKPVIVLASRFDVRLRCSQEGAVLASSATPEILTEMRNMMNRSNPEYEIFTGIHATVSQGDYFTIEEGSFRCDYKYSSKAQAWFKSVVVPANWFDARLRCSQEGAVLASPTTSEIWTEMRDIMNRSNTEYEIFTGIHATVSQGDYYTIEGTPLSKISVAWSENEPDNKNNMESCLTLNGNGELADRPCEVTRPYICYRPESSKVEVTECGTVDPEYHLDKRTNKCYKFHTEPRNFSRAFLACSAEGGHLAIINSYTEATVLRELFAKYPDAKILGNFRKDLAFIGFYDWGEKWVYRTIHGETLIKAGYNNYAPGEPTTIPEQSCGGIYRSGLLLDLWCDRPAAFFCEKSPGVPVVCRALP